MMHNFISHYFQGWERCYYLKREDKKLLTLISNSIVIQMLIIANPIDRKLKSNAIAARRSHTKVCRNALCAKNAI